MHSILQHSTEKARGDFDRIAALPEERWDHNQAYKGFLLKHLPASSDMDALEIGCGAGGFTRLLAHRSRRVLALDLSPRMIETARGRSREYDNIEYRVADAAACEFDPGRFGCAVSIATLHHLLLDPMLEKMKNALAPGGILLVLDLYKAAGLTDHAASLLAFPVNQVLKLIHGVPLIQPAQTRAAWKEHARSDVYPTLAQVRQACASVLPGAKVTRHLLWRYSIVWYNDAA